MKIIPKHYMVLESAIMAIPTETMKSMRERIVAEGKSKDVNLRLRWDCLHLTGLSEWVSSDLYSYMNDSHIDTALRSIFKARGTS